MLKLLTAMLVAARVYWPGLHGPFLFDDYANLPDIGATGPVTDAATFARYITSGTADPTGRPVAMLTFLIDARNWPADPFPFKRTNLIVHLLNALLLATLLRRMGRELLPHAPVAQTENAAVFATAWWMLHPLFVSTTLYVVQREAMLPATTVLVGLHMWQSLRTAGPHRFRGKQWALAAGVLAMTTLGALAKANGLLLPLLIGVVELCLPRNADAAYQRSRPSLLTGMVVAAPTALLLAYLVKEGLVHVVGGLPMRDWTEAQRLLTEPRVVWTYMRMLWLPLPYTAGVFNDQFTASVSLFHPWTTFASMAGLAFALAFAFTSRRRYPAWALGVLFFIGGHLLESTTIPLELYFEHRNYLPAMILFWPPSLWLAGKIQNASSSSDRAIWRVIAITILITLATMTFANARVWGDEQNQALKWAAVNPDSTRAQTMAAQAEIAQGRPAAARRRLLTALSTAPSEVQLTLNLISAECSMGAVSQGALAAARKSMQTARDPGALLTSWFGRAIEVARRGDCPGLNNDTLDELAKEGLSNPRWDYGRRQDLLHVRGQIALADKSLAPAEVFFREALALDVRPGLALNEAAALGSAGEPAAGIRHLAYFKQLNRRPRSEPQGMPRVHEWVLERQHYWPDEIASLESRLRSDMMSDRSTTRDK